MRLHIRGGHLIDPANNVDRQADIYIADGKVVGIGNAPGPFTVDQTIDATGHWVCPGLVDVSAHLREPGQGHKATIASEAQAAVRGGITTLCQSPMTRPVLDSPAVAELIRQRAEATRMIRVVTLGALTQGLEGQQLAAMAALKEAGCVGVSNGWSPIANPLVLRRAMEYAATYDLTVFLHPEDAALRNGGCAHEGAVSVRLGLPGIPQAAETVAVARDIALVEQTGVRAHFCRLSTARAVQMVARAQFDGVPVTADVAVHQLHLTEMDIADFNSQCHVRPPLRSLRDLEGLRQGVLRGSVAAVCSDHQPHEQDAKLKPFSDTEPGISGLETLLPLTLRLVNDGILNLRDAIARLTSGPAQILGIDGGHLAVGARADVCIFDPDAAWVVDSNALTSRGRNTPFHGWELKGRVTHTVFDGRLVYEG